MTRAQMARMIDHTQVRAYATQVDIIELCEEARQHGLAAVTVNPAWVSFCAKQLAGAPVGISPVVGFPLGANTAHVKVEETRECVRNGATEIDVVINIGALKSGYPQFVEKEIAAVVSAADGRPVKVILEAGYLTDDEKVLVCRLSEKAGAAYVKTSTGFGNSGATVADVLLMRDAVSNRVGIKAAGGIRCFADAMAMIDAGATRIGTSAALDIIAEMSE